MKGEFDVQLSLFGLLLLTQPLNSSEQHTRADLKFSSDFAKINQIVAIFEEVLTNCRSLYSQNTIISFAIADF